MFDWLGKNGDKSGENGDKSGKKSGNFDILCEWQPWTDLGLDVAVVGCILRPINSKVI